MTATLKARVSIIIAILRKAYPDAKCSLNFSNPLELLVATILSAQCTDARVNIVTQDLFKKYKRAEDYAAVPLEELQQDIRSTGFYKNKAKSIQKCAAALVAKHHGEVPRTIEALVELAGVGRKTANVVLGNAFDTPGIVVDTHVKRLSGRLQLSKQKDPDKIELDLNAIVPQKDWTNFCHWLIWHGRQVCAARKPDCAHCPLCDLCPSCGKV